MTDYDFSRLTVVAHGPVVEDDQRDDGLTVARESQAQIERPVQDSDDLDELLVRFDHGPEGPISAVGHLLAGEDDLRLPKDPIQSADYAMDWTIRMEGDVQAWIELAYDQGTPNPAALTDSKASDFLTSATKRDTVGPNAYLAALSVAEEADDDLTEILDRYRYAVGLDDGGDDDD